MRMRDVIDILNEYASKTIRVYDQKAIVIINPTGPEIINMVKNSEYEEIRAQGVNGKWYFWKNDNIFHRDLTRELELYYNEEYSFYVVPSVNGSVAMSPANYREVSNDILEDPYIKKWFDPVASTRVRYDALRVRSEPFTLNEYAYRKVNINNRKNVIVVINPKGNELINMIKNSPHQELRGFYNDSKFYFWWGSIIHQDMAKELKIPYDSRNSFYLAFDTFKIKKFVMVMARFGEYFSDKILNQPYIKKWFSPLTKINDKNHNITTLIIQDESSLLTEYSSEIVKYGTDEIQVAINPNYKELRNLVDNSYYKELRGICDNGKFYFWDARSMIHANMAAKLGIEYSDATNCLNLFFKGSYIVLTSDHENDIFKNLPYIKNNFYIKSGYLVAKDRNVQNKNESILKIRDGVDLVDKLNEYAFINVPGRFLDLQVAINPNYKELKTLLDKSSYKSLRGLFDDTSGKFYFWDASDFVHDQMADKLAIPDNPNSRILIYKFEDDYILAASDSISNLPYIQKNFELQLGDLLCYKLRTNKSLTEYSSEIVKYGTDEIQVAINPNYKELRKLVNESYYKELRGFFDDIYKNFYFWDSKELIHYDMAIRLGFEFGQYRKFYLRKLFYNDIRLKCESRLSLEKISKTSYFQNTFYINSIDQSVYLKESKVNLQAKRNLISIVKNDKV